MKQYTQLLNQQLSHDGESSTLTYIELGQSFKVGLNLTMSFTIPHQSGQPIFIGPDGFALRAHIVSPTFEHSVMLLPGTMLHMKQWSPLVLWPVAVDVDIKTRHINSLAIKLVALDASVLVTGAG